MSDQPRFPGQHSNETVIFKLRRHWLILLQWLAPPLILFLATVGVGVGIGLALSLSTPVWAGAILLLSIGPLGFTIWRFLDWENDHYILTNQRLLHIERVYFLFESRREANLDKVQDVTVKMPSLLANLLYFGDVEIETASTAGQITFESVPKPRNVQKLIFKETGLPEDDMKAEERWEASRLRILRPLEVLARMLYPEYPRSGDVRVWRKHWFVLLTKMISPLLAAILLLVVWIVILLSGMPALLQPIPDIVIRVIPGIFFLILVGRIAWITIDWHNDLYVLTDTHVLDIEKRPFTSEFRREANLGMIQNVSYEQPTFLSKLLDYGNTRLETAGRMGEFTFDNVPRPRHVQEVIIQHLVDFRRRNARGKPKPAPKTRDELEKILERLLSERYGLLPNPPE
ncbi:MAG: PH domain-containing protein, partial [Anaerolineae bacterium]